MYGLRDDDAQVAISDVVLSIEGALGSVQLCNVAHDDEGGPWIATLFFAALSNEEIVVLTVPSARHFRGVLGQERAAVAVAVVDTSQTLDGPKIGLQIAGTVRQLTGPKETEAAVRCYIDRFSSARSWLPDVNALAKIKSELYSIEFDTVKILDEVRFGREQWITADRLGDAK